ncbi:MAG: hypothetical protein ACI845_000632 [Gammaproteobacteria bacterium]|jgi:hypothetical protein
MRLVTLLSLSLSLLTGNVLASDHLDSQYIDELPKRDIGDLFVWSGVEKGNPVFLMSLNPLISGTAPKSKLLLDPEVLYEFKIDTNGDSEANIAYQLTVEGNTHPQTLTLYKAEGDNAQKNIVINTSEIIANGKSTPPGKVPNIISDKASARLFVGARQDPFFFNFKGIKSPVALSLRFALGDDGLPSDGTAANTFGPTNITAIVLEVPELKGKKFGVWATTSVNGLQVDRCGRASITAIFIPNTPPGRNPEYYPYNNKGANAIANGDPQDFPKQVYNSTSPVNDRDNYGELFKRRLRQLQVGEKNINKLADFFLPDIQGYDPSRLLGYPNGRNLEEDAVYWTIKELNPFMLSTDKSLSLPERNMQPLSDEFPYAAPPVGY